MKSPKKKIEETEIITISKKNLGLKRNKASSTLVSFDSYFKILQKKNPSIRNHHKDPMTKFLSQFGSTKAQEPKWFDTHLKTYG